MTRKSDDSPPSCGYYVTQPCERPMRCPVHRPILMRAKKNRHTLKAVSREVLITAAVPMDFMLYLRTLCGIDLHQRLDLEAEMAALPIQGGPCDELQRHFQVTGRPGWHSPPPKSTDPTYQVFRRVGSDGEILVTEDQPTCKSCLRSYKGPVIPLCNGHNYHVFGLGESKCSICGWARYE